VSKNSRSTYVQKPVPAAIWVNFLEVRLLIKVVEGQGTSKQKIVAAGVIGFLPVWRVHHE
jgi:hypothetical protein